MKSHLDGAGLRRHPQSGPESPCMSSYPHSAPSPVQRFIPSAQGMVKMLSWLAVICSFQSIYPPWICAISYHIQKSRSESAASSQVSNSFQVLVYHIQLVSCICSLHLTFCFPSYRRPSWQLRTAWERKQSQADLRRLGIGIKQRT